MVVVVVVVAAAAVMWFVFHVINIVTLRAVCARV